MSSILEALLGADNKSNIADLAKHLNVSEADVDNAIKHILPALSGGLKQHLQAEPNSEVLKQAKEQGVEKYMDDDNAKVYSDESVQQGKRALSTILGKEENSEQLAQQVAQSSGLSGDIIKAILPMAATMIMGSVSKQSGAQGSEQGSGFNLNSLTVFLDRNNDGSITDDLVGLASKFFGK